MNFIIIQAQEVAVEMAQKTVVEYGIIGLALVALMFFAWYQNKQLAKKDDKFIEMAIRQTQIQEKQTLLQQSQLDHSKEFSKSTLKALEDMPQRVVREMKFDELIRKQNGNNGIDAP